MIDSALRWYWGFVLVTFLMLPGKGSLSSSLVHCCTLISSCTEMFVRLNKSSSAHHPTQFQY
ncbi:hypothetical protein KC19_10G019600 [Ceratodon purpureus]|uniref:Uncharacterized protein n=1 Tax=Ceratodon purpureus TaxID=3225 RepID=A0A8T0GKS5_CERPU|nr:hypothetical protein KC19_10G019600 [Ceratodon purpureus]